MAQKSSKTFHKGQHFEPATRLIRAHGAKPHRAIRGSAFAPAASRLLRTPPIPCAEIYEKSTQHTRRLHGEPIYRMGYTKKTRGNTA
jgi:hypothetical protein